MSRTYELWDIETGNIVGEFESSEDALAVVQVLLDANGAAIAEGLVLQCRDGSTGVCVVGMGSQLVDQVAARSESSEKVPARS